MPSGRSFLELSEKLDSEKGRVTKKREKKESDFGRFFAIKASLCGTPPQSAY